jgi:hypothetical protein
MTKKKNIIFTAMSNYDDYTKKQCKALLTQLKSLGTSHDILKAIEIDLQNHKDQSKHFMKMMSKFVTSHWNENDTFIQNGRLLKLLTNSLVECLKNHNIAADLLPIFAQRLGTKLIWIVSANLSKTSKLSVNASNQARSCLNTIVEVHPQTRGILSDLMRTIAGKKAATVGALVNSSLVVVVPLETRQQQQLRQQLEIKVEAEALAEYEKTEAETKKTVRVVELLKMLSSSDSHLANLAIAELQSMVKKGDCTLSNEDMHILTLVNMERDDKIQQRQNHMLEALCRKANIPLPGAEDSLLLTPAHQVPSPPAVLSTTRPASHQKHLSPVSEGNEENEEVPVNTPRPKRPPQAAPRTPGQGLFLCNSISPVVFQESSTKSPDS